jgi:hypothetical protein
MVFVDSDLINAHLVLLPSEAEQLAGVLLEVVEAARA